MLSLRTTLSTTLGLTALWGLTLAPPLLAQPPQVAQASQTMAPVPNTPKLPLPPIPVPDPVSTLTKVGLVSETCAVYLLTHATGTQTLVVCTDADGRTQITMSPTCGN